MQGVKGSAAVSLHLSRQLAELRLQAGLTQVALAARLGWSQSKVCNMERARRGADLADVDAWLTAVEADEAVRKQVRDHHFHCGFSRAALFHLTREATVALHSMLAREPSGTRPDLVVSDAIVFYAEHFSAGQPRDTSRRGRPTT